MTEQRGRSPDETNQATLVDHLIEADDLRRKLRQEGQNDQLTIELSSQLSADERAELVRMLECADRLEALAASDGAEHVQPTRVFSDESTDLSDCQVDESIDYHIGPYRIVRLIADGGFGSVLLAIDETHDGRQVAIKVPRPDIRLTDRLRERFLIEGRAASTLNHPNIVTVHTTISDPVTAVVYEYCEGGTLTQRVAPDRPPDEKTAVEIILRLAEALHHAHTRGILHRDVKPGNVMLVGTDDPTDEHAVMLDGDRWIPKLGDFGLAKVIDDSVNQTLSGVVMGTPQFMAPEQAAGRVSELGTHTDIFSLGAIFYWLLTGQPPFDGKGTLQTLRMIEAEDPLPPRRRRPEVSAKTEAVCLKCLRKPIDARYESAAVLAEDLKHLLKGEPVTARPPSLRERLNLWGERNPALAMFTIMLTVLALVALIQQWTSNRSLQNYVAKLDAANESLRQQREDAVAAQSRAERTSYASNMHLAQRAFEDGDVRTYADTLMSFIPTTENPVDRRGPEWQALWEAGHPAENVIDQFPSAIYMVRLSSDGKYLAACGADTTVRIYDTRTWKRLKQLETGQGEVNYAAFSRDGSKVATAGDDGTIIVWDWQNGTSLLRIQAYDDDLAYCVHFFDDDQRLVTCGRHPDIRLWDAVSGEPLGNLKTKGDPPSRVEQLDVSPGGTAIASASEDGLRRVWTLSDYKPVEHLPPIESQPTSSVCLFRRGDEDWMLSGTLRERSRRNSSLILEVIGREEQRVLPIHFDSVQSVAVDPAGDMAAAGDRGGRISMIDINAAIQGPRWWHPQTIRKQWHGHDGVVYGMVFSKDGRQVISAGSDGKLSLWSPNEATDQTTYLAHRDAEHRWVHAVVANDQTIYVTDEQMQLFRWDEGSKTVQQVVDDETGQPLLLAVNENETGGCMVSSGNVLFAREVDGPVGAWEMKQNRAVRRWTAEIGENFPGTRKMALSPDGKLLAVGRQGNPTTILVLRTSTGERAAEFVDPLEIANGTRAVAFDPTGTKIAYGTGNDVFLADLATGSQTQLLVDDHLGGSREVRSLHFVQASPLLLIGGQDRVISIWNVQTGEKERELVGHQGVIECLGTHPFGDRIISTDEHGGVCIWTLQDGMLLAELPPVADGVGFAAIGDQLVGIADGATLFRRSLRNPDPELPSPLAQ